jgi:hypothetical protein
MKLQEEISNNILLLLFVEMHAHLIVSISIVKSKLARSVFLFTIHIIIIAYQLILNVLPGESHREIKLTIAAAQ